MATKSTTVKLRKNRAGLLTFQAKINGKKCNFILDTGATSTVIDFSRAPYFKLDYTDSEEMAGGLGTSSMIVKKLENLEIEIEGKVFTSKKAALMDLSHVNISLKNYKAKLVDAIFGADIMQSYNAKIDYGKKILTLFP